MISSEGQAHSAGSAQGRSAAQAGALGAAQADGQGKVVRIRPDDVVITPELQRRPRRAPDLEGLAAACEEVAALLVGDPQRAVQRALEFAARLCGAGSAGLSLLEPDTAREGAQVFRWGAITGALAPYAGGTAPRDFSPCGLCLDAGHTILVGQPFAAFDYLDGAAPPLREGLIVPLYDAGREPLGTLWVVHHDVTGRFDAEDARVAEHLAPLLALALKLRDGRAGDPVPSRAGNTGGAPGAQARPERVAVAGAADDPFVLKLHGFAALSRAEKAALRRLCADVRTAGPRTDLVREDDPSDCVVLVLKGFACRYKLRNDGSRQVVAYLVPGDMCDPDAPLLDRADHFVGTVSACTMAYVPRDVLASVMQEYPAISRAVRIASLVDEATLREWLLNVGRRTAEERLAHLFCEVLLRMRAVGLAEGNSCDLPVTQTDLADTTGLSVVHVNRVLQEMRRQGLITLSGGRLTILDLPRLRTLAEFKPNYLHLAEPRA